jgi:RNA polymerase sigma-70 factor (ECF subfamily)
MRRCCNSNEAVRTEPGVAAVTDDGTAHAPGDKRHSARVSLREALIGGYAELKQRLARRLGSSDTAEDALQETYLKLGRVADDAVIDHPHAYILRVATNLATDRARTNSRLLSAEESEALLALGDDGPGPEAIAASQSELAILTSALRELPARRREMLLASRLRQEPHRDIALRYGVTTRTVETEIKRALATCAERVGRQAVQRFGPRAVVTSSNEGGHPDVDK